MKETLLRFSLSKIVLVTKNTGLHKIKPLYFLYAYTLQKLKPEYIVFDGNKLYLDHNDSLRLSINPYWEPLYTKFVKENLKEGDVFLDVGAHIGYYTLIASQCVGKKGKVYSFEPDKNNFVLLRKNVAANHLKNVVLEKMAISNMNGTQGFDNQTESNLNPHFNKLGTVKNRNLVQAVSIDSFFKNNYKSILMIKMDIEGAELLALEGSKQVIQRNKKITLLIEFWPYGQERVQKGGTKKLLSFLRKYGFQLYEINENKGRIQKVSDSYLKNKYTVTNKKYTNLYCKRNAILKD